jgi:hypothetical protein
VLVVYAWGTVELEESTQAGGLCQSLHRAISSLRWVCWLFGWQKEATTPPQQAGGHMLHLPHHMVHLPGLTPAATHYASMLHCITFRYRNSWHTQDGMKQVDVR